MEYKDYYKTLGVARDASADESKEAYYKLPPKYDPDVSKEVQGAYEVLRVPDKHQVYNELGNNWRAGRESRPSPGWLWEFHFHTGPMNC